MILNTYCHSKEPKLHKIQNMHCIPKETYDGKQGFLLTNQTRFKHISLTHVVQQINTRCNPNSVQQFKCLSIMCSRSFICPAVFTSARQRRKPGNSERSVAAYRGITPLCYTMTQFFFLNTAPETHKSGSFLHNHHFYTTITPQAVTC